MSKPQVFGGIAVHQQAPEADLHGLFRVVVVAENKHKAKELLKRVGLPTVHNLTTTKSVVERNLADDIYGPVGTVWACDVRNMYLHFRYYRKVDRQAERKKRRERK